MREMFRITRKKKAHRRETVWIVWRRKRGKKKDARESKNRRKYWRLSGEKCIEKKLLESVSRRGKGRENELCKKEESCQKVKIEGKY